MSDKYGRKKVLLATMVGNIVSAAIWLRSTTFVRVAVDQQLTRRAHTCSPDSLAVFLRATCR